MKNPFLLSLLAAGVVFALASGAAEVHARHVMTTQAKDSLASTSTLRLNAFADRTVVNKDERFTVRAWVAVGNSVDSVIITVFFSILVSDG